MTHIFYDDGSWLYSTPNFTDKGTCIENGATYYPNGKVDTWRYTWNFSDDMMSLVVKGENLKDNVWWKAFEGKGT
jgi:phage pi2 protein 07